MNLIVDHSGWALWGEQRMRCAVGRGGIARVKSEGDGVTPAGVWPMRRVFYRADRLEKPATALPVQELAPDDGWCEIPADPAYNKLVKHPYTAPVDQLWRDDHVYDVIVELGYNDDPVVPGLGSAIFLHIARPDYTPTQGCVALALPDLLRVLQTCDARSSVEVKTP